MTTVASAVLFRSESKGSGFHANERTSLTRYVVFICALFLMGVGSGRPVPAQL